MDAQSTQFIPSYLNSSDVSIRITGLFQGKVSSCLLVAEGNLKIGFFCLALSVLFDSISHSFPGERQCAAYVVFCKITTVILKILVS